MSAEPVPPVLSPPGVDRDPAKPQGSGSSLNRFLLWGGSILLLILLALVILILPDRVNRVDQTAPPAQSSQVKDGATPPAISDTETARQDAELSLQKFLRLRAQGDLSAVEHWAPDTWSGIMRHVDSADEHYGHRRYREAQQAYESAAEGLLDLQQQRPLLLETHLTNAEAALLENRIEPASTDYQKVLAMQADHPLALKGLARATVRNQLLKQMQVGQQAQSKGNLQAALESYQAAIDLDPDYEAARFALQEVAQSLQERSFNAEMGSALASIQSGDLKAAREALETAAEIHPDNPALKDAFIRLYNADRMRELSGYRQQATGLTAEEKWKEAASVYRKVLALDSAATFAQSGLQHAEQRAQLHDQLDHYLSAPERLYSETPLNNARKLLATNPSPPPGEPILASQLEALREAVRTAGLPISLRIVSDRLTEVTIYHVGRLGSFQSRELELTPGDYTVVGARDGYRDVRKVVRLEPGSQPRTVFIRCEEPI